MFRRKKVPCGAHYVLRNEPCSSKQSPEFVLSLIKQHADDACKNRTKSKTIYFGSGVTHEGVDGICDNLTEIVS